MSGIGSVTASSAAFASFVSFTSCLEASLPDEASVAEVPATESETESETESGVVRFASVVAASVESVTSLTSGASGLTVCSSEVTGSAANAWPGGTSNEEITSAPAKTGANLFFQ